MPVKSRPKLLVDERRAEAARQLLTKLEERIAERLADLNTLEAAIQAMHRHLMTAKQRPPHEPQPR